ncbi:TerC family protein [Pyrinomonas methylaliphatogenes]|jgi:tellurite resistance protein TerC|nr:TerC family protein [Pyrinomonas methylaliphatogenes]MBX5477494.1 TerC family protein [Pyrinomonas methylaliphatogenes]
MEHSIWAWGGFTLFILLLLAVDLGLLNRRSRVISSRQAITWSIIWISLALIFAAGVFHQLGHVKGVEFLTGYLIELSLSVDNLFVFLLIFSYFRVPSEYQHRVLFWGVLGALVMRAVMILMGAALINRFHWIIYIFGAFLIFTGIRMLREEETEIHPEQNPVVRFVTRYVPITKHYEGEKFFTRVRGRLNGTLLFLVLVMVETTDLVFAVDSIPAIFAVTRDPFIVYTSNVFAILGLRTFYFLLAKVVERFHYLRIGLSIVLIFIGFKMLAEDVIEERYGYHISPILPLSIVVAVLAISIIASLIWPRRALSAPKEKTEQEVTSEEL